MDVIDVLSDFDLFVVTWILAGVSIISFAFLFYTSTQLFMHKTKQQTMEGVGQIGIRLSEEGATRIRNISTTVFILSSIIGAIISLVNWIPSTEYNYQTVFYRIFSATFGVFLALLTSGGILAYIFYIVLKEDETKKKDNIS